MYEDIRSPTDDSVSTDVTLVDRPDGTLDDAGVLARAALDDAPGSTAVTAAVSDAGGGPDSGTGGGEAGRLPKTAREVRDRLAADGFAT